MSSVVTDRWVAVGCFLAGVPSAYVRRWKLTLPLGCRVVS